MCSRSWVWFYPPRAHSTEEKTSKILHSHRDISQLYITPRKCQQYSPGQSFSPQSHELSKIHTGCTSLRDHPVPKGPGILMKKTRKCFCLFQSLSGCFPIDSITSLENNLYLSLKTCTPYWQGRHFPLVTMPSSSRALFLLILCQPTLKGLGLIFHPLHYSPLPLGVTLGDRSYAHAG